MSRWWWPLRRRNKRIEQSATHMSSLRAGLISQVLQSAQSTTHPLRAVCEAYFVSTGSSCTYYAVVRDVAQYDVPLVEQLTSLQEDIARAYITTGLVLLRRRVDDTLDVISGDRVQVMTLGGTEAVHVDGQVIAPGSYAAVVWGGRTLATAVPPWQVCSLELALDASAREYAAQVLHTDAYMRRVIIPQQELPSVAAQELAQSLGDVYRRHKGAMAVLPMPATVHEAVPAVKELGLESIAGSVETRVAAVYGIPINLLGLEASAQHQTYANREQASRDYTRRILLPYWESIARAVSRVWGVDVRVDVESIPDLREDVVESTVTLYTAGIITLDEARERLGYPAAQEQASSLELIEQSSDEMYYQSVQARYDAVARALEQAFGDALDTIVSKTSAMHDAEKRVYLYSAEYQEDLRASIAKRLRAQVQQTIEEAHREASRKGDTYTDGDPIAIARAESDRIVRELTDDAMRYTGETVRTRLLEGATELLSASYVALVANTLATAIVTRLQLATWQAMSKASKGKIKIKKYWLSMRDEKVRDSHQHMNGVSVDLSAKFSVPGEHGVELADGPGDPSLSAGNRINCRCVLRPRRVR
ncbi:MAG: hypothetical protein KatS3mg038_3985 [Candidatus Kapaibacterium sp.]|nr:MAG: hypothetical protein KatS3mg038_3985 [Candidatus Kapabacteria bacterium]